MSTEEATQIALADLIKTCQKGIKESEARIEQLRNEAGNTPDTIPPVTDTNSLSDTKSDNIPKVLIWFVIIVLALIILLALKAMI